MQYESRVDIGFSSRTHLLSPPAANSFWNDHNFIVRVSRNCDTLPKRKQTFEKPDDGVYSANKPILRVISVKLL